MSTASGGRRRARPTGPTRARPAPGRSRSARLGAVEWIAFPVSWMLIAFGVTLVYQSGRAVLAVGGSCAEGGPYVIAVPCPGQTTLLTSLGIVAFMIGSFGSIFFQRGFGAPAWGYGWVALFGWGAAAFFEAALRDDVWTWHLCGWIFVALALGAAPMLILFWPRSVLGSRALDGTEPPDGRLGVVDATVVVTVCVAATAAGVTTAGALIGATA